MRKGLSRVLPALRSALAAGMAIAFGHGAGATIVECRPASGGYSVFLSEPQFSSTAFASRDQLRDFLNRLQFELDQGRDGQWVRSPRTNVRFVVCANRAPALDGQEHSPPLVDLLHTGRVLLEIWGQFDAERPPGGAPKLSAQINYLLVPIQHASNLNETVPRALQRLLYPEDGTPSPGDYVQLIARPLDIDAFVAAALGFKLLRERERELAYGNLCRASALLAQMEKRKLASGTLKDLAALRAFSLESAARAVSEAQADPAYSKTGLLRLQDAKLPCASED